ncbi:MAG: glycosyltransferase [Chthoniobacterales bacterium]
MKILITADPELPVPPVYYGGIERIVDALVRALQVQGHTVGLMANAASTSPASQLFGWPGTSSQAKTDTLKNIIGLSKAVHDFKPDVIHSFSRLAYLGPLLFAKIPKIMSYQRHVGGTQISTAARLAGNSLRFTGCSEFICRMGRPSGGEWHAIPNFVEPALCAFGATVEKDAPLVFLSRIESIKGVDLAIRIARRAGRRLILAGNHSVTGPEGDYWKQKVEPEIGHGGIEHVGEVNDVTKGPLLAAAAALLVPIQWDEPFGIVFAEALAAGTPVISCPRGALPEIVENGKHGFLINNEDEGVEACTKIGEISRADCRARVEEKFSLSVVSAQYTKLYESLLTKRP